MTYKRFLKLQLIVFVFGGLWLVGVQAGTKMPSNMPPEVQKRFSHMSAQQQKMILSYTPELRQKVMSLSPEMMATIQKFYTSHTRHSDTLTFRQMMQEVLADYQSIVSGIAVDNAAQVADSARRLANHRIPRGGLLPYFPLDKINDESLSILVSMNETVEGNALKLAEAADNGHIAEATTYLSKIAAGCVACHQVFRGQPGVSPLLSNQLGGGNASD
jgi:hypothetical protein